MRQTNSTVIGPIPGLWFKGSPAAVVCAAVTIGCAVLIQLGPKPHV